MLAPFNEYPVTTIATRVKFDDTFQLLIQVDVHAGPVGVINGHDVQVAVVVQVPTGDAGHILLEGVPPGLDVEELKKDLCAISYVVDIHHVHAWSISQERPMVTLHADIEPGTDSIVAIREIKYLLADKFDIPHATVEIEYGDCIDEPHHHHGAAC